MFGREADRAPGRGVEDGPAKLSAKGALAAADRRRNWRREQVSDRSGTFCDGIAAERRFQAKEQPMTPRVATRDEKE